MRPPIDYFELYTLLYREQLYVIKMHFYMTSCCWLHFLSFLLHR
jgi:hypothetical protein